MDISNALLRSRDGYLMVAVSTFALGSSSFAATVTPIEGTVQVNTGSGFRPVSGAAEVAPGTSVMVSPNGRGKISYSDGCKAALHSGSVAVIPPVSPCAKGQALSGYDGNASCYSDAYVGRNRCDDGGIYIIGGAVAAVAGVSIWAATRSDNNNSVFAPQPASP
jgi:hypothetical protein